MADKVMPSATLVIPAMSVYEINRNLFAARKAQADKACLLVPPAMREEFFPQICLMDAYVPTFINFKGAKNTLAPSLLPPGASGLWCDESGVRFYNNITSARKTEDIVREMEKYIPKSVLYASLPPILNRIVDRPRLKPIARAIRKAGAVPVLSGVCDMSAPSHGLISELKENQSDRLAVFCDPACADIKTMTSLGVTDFFFLFDVTTGFSQKELDQKIGLVHGE